MKKTLLLACLFTTVFVFGRQGFDIKNSIVRYDLLRPYEKEAFKEMYINKFDQALDKGSLINPHDIKSENDWENAYLQEKWESAGLDMKGFHSIKDNRTKRNMLRIEDFKAGLNDTERKYIDKNKDRLLQDERFLNELAYADIGKYFDKFNTNGNLAILNREQKAQLLKNNDFYFDKEIEDAKKLVELTVTDKFKAISDLHYIDDIKEKSDNLTRDYIDQMNYDLQYQTTWNPKWNARYKELLNSGTMNDYWEEIMDNTQYGKALKKTDLMNTTAISRAEDIVKYEQILERTHGNLQMALNAMNAQLQHTAYMNQSTADYWKALVFTTLFRKKGEDGHISENMLMRDPFKKDGFREHFFDAFVAIVPWIIILIPIMLLIIKRKKRSSTMEN